MFASKPQLAEGLLDRAHSARIRAFVAGDDVYGGRALRRGIRTLTISTAAGTVGGRSASSS